MELVEDKYNSDFNINKYVDNTVTINGKSFSEPIIFFERTISSFPVNNPKLININDIEKYLEWDGGEWRSASSRPHLRH